MTEKKRKVGRPKKTPRDEEIINETAVEKLEMSQKVEDKKVTLNEVTDLWKQAYEKIFKGDSLSYFRGPQANIGSTMEKWNSLNPFLQNQRLKGLFTAPGTFSKAELGGFLANPGSNEAKLRAAAWINSSSQQIYYNILRRAADIPQYNYFVVPDLLDKESDYDKVDFKNEDRLVNEWLELFNIPNSLKTIALQVKREGKQSYILRNRIDQEGNKRRPVFAALEKLPTDWIKITGIGQLGYTVSMNFMYFMQQGHDPRYFGEFIEDIWEDLISTGVVVIDDKGRPSNYDVEKMRNYSFIYGNQELKSSLEIINSKREKSYMFWVQLPYDICFTFGSDNSNPWVAPDTMGLLMKLQELTDYGTLAGLIASTPLTAILTGEAEFIDGARANKNETKISPEVLSGLQDLFNATTSTNVEAMFFPLKNIKLQQLSADVNSSDIISNATENFVETAGEGGLTITSDKPNVSQIKTAQLLAASQQRYVTLQIENALNFIIQNKLGMKYKWRLKIWGDIFTLDSEKKYLKEIVANGNIALLPKLMSAEGISMRDTKAITMYIKQLDFYKEFKTYTMEKSNELKEETNVDQEKTTSGQVGRPSMSDGEVENESTAKSHDDGTNTTDNRDTLSLKCPICGDDLEEGQIVCEECMQKIIDNAGE